MKIKILDHKYLADKELPFKSIPEQFINDFKFLINSSTGENIKVSDIRKTNKWKNLIKSTENNFSENLIGFLSDYKLNIYIIGFEFEYNFSVKNFQNHEKIQGKKTDLKYFIENIKDVEIKNQYIDNFFPFLVLSDAIIDENNCEEMNKIIKKLKFKTTFFRPKQNVSGDITQQIGHLKSGVYDRLSLKSNSLKISIFNDNNFKNFMFFLRDLRSESKNFNEIKEYIECEDYNSYSPPKNNEIIQFVFDKRFKKLKESNAKRAQEILKSKREKNKEKNKKLVIIALLVFAVFLLGIYINFNWVVFFGTFFVSILMFFAALLINSKSGPTWMFSIPFLSVWTTVTLIAAVYLSNDGTFQRLQEEGRASTAERNREMEEEWRFKKAVGVSKSEYQKMYNSRYGN